LDSAQAAEKSEGMNEADLCHSQSLAPRLGQVESQWRRKYLPDCISLFILKEWMRARPKRVVEERQFMAEAGRLAPVAPLCTGWRPPN
jgi:hypothetical protein